MLTAMLLQRPPCPPVCHEELVANAVTYPLWLLAPIVALVAVACVVAWHRRSIARGL